MTKWVFYATADNPGVRTHLMVREDGRIEARLLVPLHGCSVTLQHHGQKGDTRHIKTGPAWEPRQLDATLQRLLSLDEARARATVDFGAVYLDGHRAMRADEVVLPDAYLRVHLEPKEVAMPSSLEVVCETDEFVVCNKPAGVPIHGTIDNLHQNVLSGMARQLGIELLVTSRLDMPTSGLLVLAKTRAWQAHFNELLRERKVVKDYIALVHPRAADIVTGSASSSSSRSPPLPQQLLPKQPQLQRALVHWMDGKSREPKQMRAEPIPGWQRCECELLHARAVCALPAVLEHGVESDRGMGGVAGDACNGIAGDACNGVAGVACSGGVGAACSGGCCHARSGRYGRTAAVDGVWLYELQLRLHTGRTHQLRAQLAFEGYPIVGDVLYGAPPLDGLPNLRYNLATKLRYNLQPLDGLPNPPPHVPDVAENAREPSTDCISDSSPDFITDSSPLLPAVRLPCEPIGLHAYRLRFANAAAPSHEVDLEQPPRWWIR